MQGRWVNGTYVCSSGALTAPLRRRVRAGERGKGRASESASMRIHEKAAGRGDYQERS